MVKCIVSILVAALLLLGAVFGEFFSVEKEVSAFEEQVQLLYDKTQAEQATDSDATAVVRSWESRKRYLHIWIPHNDINRIDEYLAEGAGLIGAGEYAFALAKLEVLLCMLERLPGTYLPTPENVL